MESEEQLIEDNIHVECPGAKPIESKPSHPKEVQPSRFIWPIPSQSSLVEQSSAPAEEDHDHIILFVNFSSGGNKAKEFTRINSDRILFLMNDIPVELRIYSLNDEKSRLRGFAKLYHLEKGRVIIAGGDGSVMWVYDHMIRFNVDPLKFPIGIIPFGTGNDLAANSGWGRKPPRELIGKFMKALQGLVVSWTKAIPVPMDLWVLEVTVKPIGHFISVKNDGTVRYKSPLTEADGTKTLTYRRIFSNYMSFGIDAKIGIGFERKRTKSKCGNKIRYAWEGFKKMWCGCIKTPRIKNIIECMKQNGEVIFRAEELDKNPVNIIWLNIATMFGADLHLWKTSKQKSSLKLLKETRFQEASSNDGMLEFLTFPSGFRMALEQVPCLRGQSSKLHQGTGPFTFEFKEMSEKERFYFQVDGEFIQASCPQSMTISKYDKPISMLHKSAS